MPGTTAGFPIRPARAWRVVGVLLATVTTATTMAWVWTLAVQGDSADAWPALPALALLIWAAGWQGEAGGRLFDDGESWQVEDPARGLPPQSGRLVVAIDLGRWMLLRFRPIGSRRPGGQRWLALSRRDMPADWQAFRRAVYSPRLSPAGRSAQAPADPPA